MDKNQLAIIFGEELRKIQAKKRISQEELALKADIDRTYISKLERGIRQPSLVMIFKICETLEIEPDKLIRTVKTNFRTSS